MAVSTVDEYLSALEKSKLLGSEQLVEAQRLAGESSDAAALARALARNNLVSRWQADTLLALGQRAQLRLGKYKLIQKLGKGGMGTVFLAEHVTMNRRVALKIVPRSIAEDRASLDRFFAEARAIAALDHPNIVQAYSVDNEMDRYFIVMEFVDGQDLQRMVQLNGPLDFDHAADYIRQAAEGLAHAHARNLVHCDVKPSNLLVNNQGVIKILDLGLARLNRSDEPRGAAAGEPAFGTVDYMAPEQALETKNFDHRADIYSLGCTLYFLLTGHPPFPEGTLAQRIVKHQTQEPRDILLERPDAPPKLIEICKRMMAKEPENRYQSIQEVSAALAPWQRGADAAAGSHAPRAVMLLDDAIPTTAVADDWLSSLTVPSKSNATSNGLKTPASSAKQQHKGQSSGGIAAAPAGLFPFGRARLGWFNTTKRKIVGAVGGIAVLAAAAGLAALPFLPSQPKPPPQVARLPKPPVTKPALEDDVGPPPDKSAGKRPDTSKPPPGKDSPEVKSDLSNKSKISSENPPKSVPPNPAGPDKSAPKPPNKTDVPPKTQPDATPAPKAIVTPAPPDKTPQPPAKPPEAAKPLSLDGLAAEVDLPQPGKGANDPVSLGKLDLDPKLPLDLQLLGGDAVAKSKCKFALQKEGDGANPGWSVEMVDKSKEAVKIARVWQEGSDWKIQWAAEAKDKATLDKAALVRYCGLQFSCEKKTHFIALTKPKTVDPLAIDFEKVFVRERLSREVPLPDPSALQLQILPLDKSMPPHTIKILEPKGRGGRPPRGRPAEPVPGNKAPVKGHVFVMLTKENTPRVAFDILFFDARGKDATVEMRATCEISGREAPFNSTSLQQVAAGVEAYLMMNEAPQNKNARKPPAEQLQAVKMAKDQLKALGVLVGELSQKASIPFRIYAVLGASDDETSPKVVIFQSGQLDNPKAGGKKNPKGNKKGRATPDADELKLK